MLLSATNIYLLLCPCRNCRGIKFDNCPSVRTSDRLHERTKTDFRSLPLVWLDLIYVHLDTMLIITTNRSSVNLGAQYFSVQKFFTNGKLLNFRFCSICLKVVKLMHNANYLKTQIPFKHYIQAGEGA